MESFTHWRTRCHYGCQKVKIEKLFYDVEKRLVRWRIVCSVHHKTFREEKQTWRRNELIWEKLVLQCRHLLRAFTSFWRAFSDLLLLLPFFFQMTREQSLGMLNIFHAIVYRFSFHFPSRNLISFHFKVCNKQISFFSLLFSFQNGKRGILYGKQKASLVVRKMQFHH